MNNPGQRETKKTLNSLAFRAGPAALRRLHSLEKDSLAVARPAYHVSSPMTKRLLLCFFATTTIFSSGCVLSRFRKSDKPKEPKESSAIATDVEREFKQRWISQRVSQLGTQGITGQAAQDQAAREFAEKFSFPAHK